MSRHVEELAELYALGALEPREASRVDAHVAVCAECARRVGEAEATVGALLRTLPEETPSPELARRIERAEARAFARPAFAARWPAALAACLAVAILFGGAYAGSQYLATRAAMSQDRAMLAQLAATPLNSARFSSMGNAPVEARVLYDARGTWYCVVVRRPARDMQIAYVRPDGSMEKIGTLRVRGDMGVAVMPIRHKMERLALLAGSAVVAEARLAY